jgi:hypothetical protein
MAILALRCNDELVSTSATEQRFAPVSTQTRMFSVVFTSSTQQLNRRRDCWIQVGAALRCDDKLVSTSGTEQGFAPASTKMRMISVMFTASTQQLNRRKDC